MLRFLFGFKWQKSQAHLLLLTKFLRPHTIEDYENSFMPWKQVLRETATKAIKRFLDEGVIERADIVKSLEWKYKVPELKKILKERNLPSSGSKNDLILRLIEADPKGMSEDVSGLNVLSCSERGRQIADDYLTIEKEKGRNAEQRVLVALQNRRFKEASLACSSFEVEQVFPTGIGIASRDTSRDIAVLKVIFDSNPKILRNPNKRCLGHLRLAAGMMYLWGPRLGKGFIPPNLETGLLLDGITAARMIVFHAINQVHLVQYREWGARLVDISIAGPSSCDACKKIAKKKFKIDEVVELPYEGCTSETGCRCMVQVVSW